MELVRAIAILVCLAILSACTYTPPPAPLPKGEFSSINPEYTYVPPEKPLTYFPEPSGK